jgi:hypothetical protein
MKSLRSMLEDSRFNEFLATIQAETTSADKDIQELKGMTASRITFLNDGHMILPRKTGHLSKPPFVPQTFPGLSSQVSNEDEFCCSTLRYNQTHDFLQNYVLPVSHRG